MPGVRLREHQVDATARIRTWAGFPARSAVPAKGARATLVSATGSGKTITAATAALDLFRDGRILVMVPTLDLLVQTAQAWRTVGHRGPMVGVCSLQGDEVLERLGVRTTTNPIQLALWAGAGPVVVLATYASLVDRDDPEDITGLGRVRGPLEAALAGGDRLYGQRMRGFDLAVVDEAHGTAGDLGRAWAAIHDNARIPVSHRLYMTATPRILAAPRPPAGKDGRELEIASMSDDPAGTYGQWIYELGLSEAVERGILAGFEIDVLEIQDPDLTVGASEEAVRGRRLALLQTALLEHAAKFNLRTVMTFHQRVEEAAAFTAKLPETAAELYASEVTEHARAEAQALPASSIGAQAYELTPHRHLPPDRVWAQWLCGDHLVSERRETLHQFANGVDAHGRGVHRAFLASVRVLGEGVDITGERGVEAVCFADTRGSQVEIVQNIGRALRPNPDGTAKTARIIVPVFLEPGEDPDNMIASASYRPLVAVLQGLRSHDEHLVEQLANRALSSGQRTLHVERDADGRIIGADGGTANREGDRRSQSQNEEGAVESALVHFSSPRDPATVAAFLRTRVYRPESLVWLEGYQALRRWRAENGITGVYAVPYDTEVKLGVARFPLGRWIHQQRRAHRAGELEERRRKLLDEPDAGMVWEPGDQAWETKLATFRAFRRAHGHLAPRQDAVWSDGPGGETRPVPIGQHLANLRRKSGLGTDPERATTRAAQLASIDPDWNCPWPLDWQRHHAILRGLAQTEPDGTIADLQPGVMYEGDDLGAWIARQTRNWTQLTEEQQRRLTALGLTPAKQLTPPPSAQSAKKPSTKAEQAFQRGLQALAQFIAREGHRRVPRAHTEPITIQATDGGPAPEVAVRLGVFLSNHKTRRDKLTEEQRTALAELGMEWA
ncbi:Helicase associated domain protein [Actinacidiphila glaucinigra]|uniref:DEAD/DEAH box helicase n=1 Tax=Actinacidiphila glaucinigra TaxID=235986 RepID=UPI002DDB04B9|nr:Helicase associated domain protein [Actinacidiphila glaucinigra]WSD64779.1 Helicase associated domain protein [Actinacidiphila glaucinigra]